MSRLENSRDKGETILNNTGVLRKRKGPKYVVLPCPRKRREHIPGRSVDRDKPGDFGSKSIVYVLKLTNYHCGTWGN